MSEQILVPDRRWILVEGGKCRRKFCQTPAAAGLYRRHHSPNRGYHDVLWRYCVDHMYRRQIIENRVVFPVAVDSPAAERGYMD